MGKAGRIACIFTPYAMTIISMVLVIIVELGGKSPGSSLLNSVYAWQADFSNLKFNGNLNVIGQAVKNAHDAGQIKPLYQIHIYVRDVKTAWSDANCNRITAPRPRPTQA